MHLASLEEAAVRLYDSSLAPGTRLPFSPIFAFESWPALVMACPGDGTAPDLSVCVFGGAPVFDALRDA